MKKKILFTILLLTLIVFSACQKEKGENTYTNEELSFTLEMPSAWKGNYEAVTDKDVVFFYYGTGEEKTPIFTIKRYYGTNIEQEDLVRVEENNQILDKVFDTTFVSGYKYKLKDGDFGQTPPADLEQIFSRVQGILDSFESTLESPYRTTDKTSREQFFGTLHCQMIMPNYYKIAKDKEKMVSYNFLLKDKVVGVINMIPYGSGISDEIKDGLYIEYKQDPALKREYRIAMLSEYIERYNFEIMMNSFRFLPGPTNIVDKMSEIIQNSTSKKEALFGRITSVNTSAGAITLAFDRIFYDDREATESQVKEGSYTFKLSKNCKVVPFAGPDYIGHSDYLFYDNANDFFASDDYNNNKDQLYYLSFNSDDEVTGIVAEKAKAAEENINGN